MLYTYSSQYRDASRVRELKKKTGTAVNAACQGNFSACHSFVNSDLRERGLDENIEAASNVEVTYEHKSEHPWKCFNGPRHTAKTCIWACFYVDCTSPPSPPPPHTYIYTHTHTRAQRVEPERSTISVETITNLLFSMV